jgi:hypothetical protein
MRYMTKNISSPTRSPRISVPVTPEVLHAFQRMAKASNMSTGKAMAEWLADTLEGVEFLALKMEQARAAPKVVMREMHAYALGLADETGDLVRKMTAKGKADRAAAPGRALARTSDADGSAAVAIPPSCNTGGKLPKSTKRDKGLKSGIPMAPAMVQAYADTNGVPPKGKK